MIIKQLTNSTKIPLAWFPSSSPLVSFGPLSQFCTSDASFFSHHIEKLKHRYIPLTQSNCSWINPRININFHSIITKVKNIISLKWQNILNNVSKLRPHNKKKQTFKQFQYKSIARPTILSHRCNKLTITNIPM